MVETCQGCTDAAQGNMKPRAVRIAWTIDTLQGIRPAGTDDPQVIRVNVDHTLYLAERRHSDRNMLLPDHAVRKEWHELGTAQKIELVESLADFWPKEGVPA